MLILGIETSCDETSASVVKDGRTVVSNIVSSQIAIHKKYFGVVPELASRAHVENVNSVLEACLKKAGISFNEINSRISAVAYTSGPGLAGSLLAGQVTAQTLAFMHDIPLAGVNHLEGHMFAALLEHKNLKPPYLCLIVSGGHTELVIVKDYGKYKVLGTTRDDAAGEAFDKVAKLLELSYPGGPVIDKLSKKGDPGSILFPRPYMWPTWEFSFSGLKTAVVNYVRKNGSSNVSDICAAFQAAVVDTLTEKTIAAAKKFKMKNIVLGGGVAANSSLRAQMAAASTKEGLNLYLPSLEFCTDNAAMIACAGYYKFRVRSTGYGVEAQQKIEPNLKLSDWE